MTGLSATPPVEPALHPIGRRTVTLTDDARDGRSVPLELWYPSVDSDAPFTLYDLLPGVSFSAAHARHEPGASVGSWPLIVFTHGRTGMRGAYTLLCEALAARGAVVVSADHAGDTLLDWLLGTHVDDAANESNRIGDIALVLDAVLDGHPAIPADITASVDRTRVGVVGHSYGAHGAFGAVAGRRGHPPETRIGAIASLQGYTRLISDAALGRVTVPTLLVVSTDDRTTPPDTDADRPWATIPARPLWRLDLAAAAHQASSDMGLYAELAHHVELPDIVRQYLAATTVDAVGPGIRPYRDLLAVQVNAVWSFFELAWGGSHHDSVTALAGESGVTLRRR